MKKLFIINALIFSGLSAFTQNVNQGNVVLNENTNTQQSITYVSVTTIPINNVGNTTQTSARSNFRSSNNTNVQTASLPKQQKVKTNKKPPVQNNLGNVYDNNVGNLSNPQVNTNISVNDVNLNSNPNASENNVNKTANNKPVVVEESHGSDFKQIGLSGRDYSNGGKLKKGQKNFYQPQTTKVKHKKRPGYKKVKYHTSKCASW